MTLRGWKNDWRKPRSTRVRTPEVRQGEHAECGLAALAIVFGHHGLHVTMAELRQRAGSVMSGSTIRHLRDVAHDHGFEAKGFRIEPDDLVEIGFPVIAHMRFIHFVVVEHVGADVVHVNDPGNGPMILERTEFDRDFTGIVLSLEPRTVKRHCSSFSFPAALWRGWKAQWPLLAASATASLGGGGAASAGVWLLAAGVESPASGVVLLATSACAGAISVLAAEMAGYRARQRQSVNVFAALSCTGNEHYLFSRPERTLDQFAALDRIQDTNLPMAFLATLWLLAAMVSGVALAPASVLPVAVAAFVQIWLTTWASCRRGSRLARYGHATAAAHGIDGDHLVGSGWYRIGGGGDALFSSLAGAHAQSASEVFKAAAERAPLRMSLLVLDLAKFALALFFVEHDETAGLVLALGLAAASTAGIHRIARDYPAQALKDALLRLGDLPCTPKTQQSPRQAQSDRTFRMDRASWQPDGSRTIVANLSVVIASGQILVVHGPSGAGATSFARLASGMVGPTSGSVTLNGRALSSHTSATAILVDHSCQLSPGTLRDNLSLGADDIDDDDMLEALRLLDLHQIVEPRGGLAFLLKNDQPRLSGGQLRRIAIARALCRRPQLLVFDQALDNVETALAITILGRIKALGIIVIVTTKNAALLSAGDHRLDFVDARAS